MNGRSYVLRMFLFFICQLTFSDVRQPTFSKTSPRDVALAPYDALLWRLPESAPQQKRGANTPIFRPILRLIATYYAPSLMTWKENRKSKTTVFISDY